MSRFDNVKEYLAENNPDALLADGFESALIGVCNRFGQPTLAMYDYDKCIQILMDRDGMTNEEADEWMSFNVLGAWHGEGTPCFVTLFEDHSDDLLVADSQNKEEDVDSIDSSTAET